MATFIDLGSTSDSAKSGPYLNAASVVQIGHSEGTLVIVDAAGRHAFLPRNITGRSYEDILRALLKIFGEPGMPGRTRILTIGHDGRIHSHYL